MTNMKPEDKIMQSGGLWPRVYKHRFEITLFLFMAVGMLATVISALIPDSDRYSAPAVLDGLLWGIGACVLAILAYLGWWLWVALFDKNI